MQSLDALHRPPLDRRARRVVAPTRRRRSQRKLLPEYDDEQQDDAKCGDQDGQGRGGREGHLDVVRAEPLQVETMLDGGSHEGGQAQHEHDHPELSRSEETLGMPDVALLTQELEELVGRESERDQRVDVRTQAISVRS